MGDRKAVTAANHHPVVAERRVRETDAWRGVQSWPLSVWLLAARAVAAIAPSTTPSFARSGNDPAKGCHRPMSEPPDCVKHGSKPAKSARCGHFSSGHMNNSYRKPRFNVSFFDTFQSSAM